jgi:methylated-DNA-protein-cysteine methyltransferase-like protein
MTRARPRARAKSTFDEAVAAVVRAIPRGQTLSYAQVALYAGKPGAARAVVQALNRVTNIPWWRVIRSDGTVAPQMAPKQLPRLKAEGFKPRRR